ncbi:MAG: hypothetical protein AAGD06_15245 [Acidobacteriota bacterium]
MVEFVTLLLGLVVGPTFVEVAPSPPAVAVELRLDGTPVATIRRPPWTADIDFGDELAPRRLEAVAIDDAGREVARVAQVVNYARSSYEAALILDPASPGKARRGRLVWRAVLDLDPETIELRFDNAPLAVDPGGTFELPAHDPQNVHALEATLTFPDGSLARADLALGGVHGERVTSALTAVPISSSPNQPWPVEAVSSWLEAAREGTSIPQPFATSAEPGVVFMVKDPASRADLRQVQNALLRWGNGRPQHSGLLTYSVHAASPRPLRLGNSKQDGTTFELWNLGKVHPEQGLWAHILGFQMPQHPKAVPGSAERPKRGKKQMWDSLALAGAQAARTNRPRALVLILSGPPATDRSQMTLAGTARYLERIRVPFYLWVPDRKTRGRLEAPPTARVYAGLRGMVEMQDDVTIELASQTMVWLEGEFLPQEVTLSAMAPEHVELVR